MGDILTNLKRNIPKYVPESNVSRMTEGGFSVFRNNHIISESHAVLVESCGEAIEDEILRISTRELVDFIIKERLYTISSKKDNLSGATMYTVEIKVKNNQK